MASKRKKGDPSFAVAYLRVSKEEQALGMEAQWYSITSWAEANGVTILHRCDDQGVGGGSALEDRPGLLEALAMLKAGKAGRFIAHKADRLGRDSWLTGCIRRDIRSMGVELTLTEGTSGDLPEQILMATIEDAFAEYERAKIRARTKAALAAKRRKGQKTGGDVPFGFQLRRGGVHLDPCPAEYHTLLRILLLRRAGMGGRRMAATLTAEGHRPRGKEWHPGNLQTLADRWLGTELPPQLKADLEPGEYQVLRGKLPVTLIEAVVTLPPAVIRRRAPRSMATLEATSDGTK